MLDPTDAVEHMEEVTDPLHPKDKIQKHTGFYRAPYVYEGEGAQKRRVHGKLRPAGALQPVEGGPVLRLFPPCALISHAQGSSGVVD